jgi:hypothetical protein
MAMLLKSNGQRQLVKPQGKDETLTLEQMQKAVGGYIEVVPVPGSNTLLIVNEEGWMKNLPVNVNASRIAGQTIVGDVILAITYKENYK